MLPGILLLFLANSILWEQPRTPVETASLEGAARGVAAPMPPFVFQQEDLSGTSAKVMVRDRSGRLWQVKGGPEGRADAFVTRLVSALGYYADAVWFLREGRIEGVRGQMRRASGFVRPDGSFTYAAFELREHSGSYRGDGLWTWARNPFVGSRELAGLKIIAMLVSNWDNKDARDVSMGSNTGVMEVETRGERRDVYFVNDWGQSLGSWGWFLWFGRSNWSCSDYRAQSPEFVRAGSDGQLRFGYRGQHTDDFTRGITAEDARWLLQYLGRVSVPQIRMGLRASGALAAEEECLAHAITQRIELLKRAAQGR